MKDQNTSQRILSVAREILAADGHGGVSFDAIARRIGCSKQAVLYWYPSKRDLLLGLYQPWLEAETVSAESAVAGAVGRSEAIERFVRAVISFHTEDLDRYRMMYLAPQTTSARNRDKGITGAGDEIHSVTGRLYGALAAHLGGAPEAARQQAVAIHSAALGLVLMFSLADSTQDPLRHSNSDLIDALVASLTDSRRAS